MISSEQIQQAVERLVAAANPSKVILFGSYARGDATENSDLDLMARNNGVKSCINTFQPSQKNRRVKSNIPTSVSSFH